MSLVATRIFLQGSQWCVDEYGTQVTADHSTGKTLRASAREKINFHLFNCVHFIYTNHYGLCYPQKTKYIVPCETALSGLIHAAETFVRKLRSSATKNYGMACPRMRTEERTPMTANILNNQSRTSEKGWSSNLSVGRRC
jgi:hypothetical protein